MVELSVCDLGPGSGCTNLAKHILLFVELKGTYYLHDVLNYLDCIKSSALSQLPLYLSQSHHIELQQVPASVRTTIKGKLPQQQLLLEAQVLKSLMSLPQVPASVTTTMKGKLP